MDGMPTPLQTSKPKFRQLFSCLLWFSLFLMAPLKGATPISLDLHQQTWEKTDSITLDGPWEFFWDRLLMPGEATNEPDAVLETIKVWPELKNAEGLLFPIEGRATYRLRIQGLTPLAEGYQILITGVDSAATLYVYTEGREQEAISTGVGRIQEGREIPSRKPFSLTFYPRRGETTILLLQVMNHHHSSGGLWLPPQLGPHSKVRILYEWDAFLNILGLGVTLALGISSFLIYVRRRDDKPALFMALTASFAVTRSLVTTPFILAYLPDSSLQLQRILEFSSISATMLFYQEFLRAAFGPHRYRKSGLVLRIFHLGIILGTLCLSPLQFTKSLFLIQIAILGSMLFFFRVVKDAILARAEGAYLVLIGLTLQVSGAFLDIMITYEWNVIGFMITPLCYAIFLILQGQLIAKRAALAYEKSEHYAAELIEKEKARTIFFQNTSHELRTPLNGIIGFLELVHKGRYGTISEAAQRQIEKSMKLAISLKHQVNTILDLAKSRKGELKKTIQWISLPEIKEAADDLAEGLRLKSPRLSYFSRIELPEEGIPYYSDHEKISTILRNLLGNAFKFTDAERPNHVELSIRWDSKILQIVVSDTGIGIPKEFQSKVFEEFAQVQGDARRAYEGTGLGLTMVRDLVRLLDGYIELESQVGMGTRFTVQLPSQDPALISRSVEPKADVYLPQLSLSSPQAPESQKGEDLKRPTHPWSILVIDDIETNCEVISEILRTEGYQVHFELSGAAGLEYLKHHKPDLILLDMMMPEMTGEDTLKYLKADSELQSIPVILVTARASEEDKLSGLRMGFDDYLPKPIMAEELRLRVYHLLERNQMLQRLSAQESLDKFVQLGTLFADLSHEIKNILQGAGSIPSLTEEHAQIAVAPFSISDELRSSLGRSLSQGQTNLKALERIETFPPIERDALYLIRTSLRALLSESLLNQEEMLQFWEQIQSYSPDELVFLENQMRILMGFQNFARITSTTWTLSQSVLTYTRTQGAPTQASLVGTWNEVKLLARSRTKRFQVEWQENLEDCLVPMGPGELMQILLNLTLNAIDAIKSLDKEHHWVHISNHTDGKTHSIRFANGGPPIPSEIQAKLFQRGFSTKGTAGSGIGLAVCRRLAQKVGGDFRYDAETPHPCFILELPKLDGLDLPILPESRVAS